MAQLAYLNAMNKGLNHLSNDDLLQLAPSIGALQPSDNTSDRYRQIKTIEVVEALRSEGWTPNRVAECSVRLDERRGFQKHMIRFSHPNLIMDSNGQKAIGDVQRIECVLTNSHDGTAAYQFYLGIFRLVCTNGAVVGDTFDRVSIKHIGFKPEQALEASKQIYNGAPKIMERIREFRQIVLSGAEMKIFAESIHEAIYEDPDKAPIRPIELLHAHRRDDQRDDLYTAFQKAQENVIRGGLRGVNPETHRRVTTREVKSIDRNIKLNRAIWNLTEKMAELKKAS